MIPNKPYITKIFGENTQTIKHEPVTAAPATTIARIPKAFVKPATIGPVKN